MVRTVIMITMWSTSRTRHVLQCFTDTKKKEKKREEKAWLCHQKILKCTNLELSFFSASGPAQIVCLITETHSHCAGEAAPHQHIITVSETWIIIMCVCVYDRDRKGCCVQKKHWHYLREATWADKGPCLCLAPTAPSSSLSVSILFFLFGRCWLSRAKWKELVKLPH